MSENEKNKKLQELLARLNSPDNNVVIGAIGDIRKAGNPSMIPYILELLRKNKDANIQSELSCFMSDLIHQDAVVHLMQALSDTKYKEEMPLIVSALWQSRLDFSDYLSKFVEMAIKEDFIVAFDCLTIIENSMSLLSDKSIREAKEALSAMEYSKDRLAIVSAIKDVLSTQ